VFDFLLKRSLNGLFVLLGVVTLIFLLFNVLPADPARMVMGQRSDEQSLEAVRRDMGLDQPAFTRYLKYINDLLPLSIHEENEASFFYLDEKVYTSYQKLFSIGTKTIVLKKPYLRRSFQTKDPVTRMIGGAIVNTFILALCAIILASVIGVTFGIWAALKKDKVIDRVLLFVSALGMSVPSFFAAILSGWFFAYVLGDFTGLNLTGNIVEIDDFGEGEYVELKNLILPALTLAVRPLSVFLQLTRNSVLDVLAHDYIRTARSKGLSKYQIIRRHVLRNALNPVITSISGWFASLMAGVVFIEYIFGWKGLGYMVVDALNNFDVPLIMGCILTIACVFVVINILVDIVYGWLDPRVRLS
jgi:peptide/nickel transport system permease protein